MMREKERIETTKRAGHFEKMLKSYAHHRYFLRLGKRLHRAIEKANSDSKCLVLEVGCGHGQIIESLSRFKYRCVGLDPNLRALCHARQRLETGVPLVCGEAEAISTSGGLFDVVILRGVVHHLHSPETAFSEIRRVLRPGGLVIIFEGNPKSLYRALVLSLAYILRVDHETSPFPHLSAEQIIRFMPEGMELVEADYVSGLFAPLALRGLGGRRTWALLGWLEDNVVLAYLIRWYNFLVFRRNT